MKKICLFLLCGLLLLTAGCGKTPNYPVEIGGASVKRSPAAVVGLSPYLNEIIYGLEKSDVLAGRSEYCAFNGNVRELPSCGTCEEPDVEKILELAPQVVLTAVELPSEAADALAEAEIAVCVLPVPTDWFGVSQRVNDLAVLLAGNNKAEALAQAYLEKLNGELDYIRTKLDGVTQKTAVFFVAEDGSVVTGDTLMGDVLRLCGLKNVAEEYRNYQMPADEILEADPEVVIVSNPPSLEWLTDGPFAELSAVRNGTALEADYAYVEDYAPSVTELLYGLAYAIYPEAMAAPDVADDPDTSYPGKPDVSVPQVKD